MYLTNILNDLHRIQFQMGKNRYRDNFFGIDGFIDNFPAVEIYSNADRTIVRVEVPGLSEKDIELSITEDILSISGEFVKSSSVENGKEYTYLRRERKTGKFQKTIELPAPVDADRAEAVLTNGILTVSFPLKEEVKPKQISIVGKVSENK